MAREPLTLADFRSEPYRALFPLGLAFAVVGMGIWLPWHFAPHAMAYPGAMHATLQIQGFLLCFVIGFLGTMLPKVHGVPPLGHVQFFLFVLPLAGLNVAALAGWQATAQLLHLGVLANLFAFMLLRWPRRSGNPPPFFLFIALGLAADLAGTLLKLAVLSGGGLPGTARMASLLQYQAFPLMLVLGVGGFLLPKILVHAPVDPRIPPAPGPGILLMLTAAGVFLAGYVVEAFLPVHPASARLGAAMRAVVWAWFLFGHVGLHRRGPRLPAYLAGARWSLLAIGLGMALQALFPRYLLAWEHVVFVTGILWLTLSIAVRVVTSHGGTLAMADARRGTVIAYGWLLVLAAGLRVAADLWMTSRSLQLATAGVVAVAALLLWIVVFARNLARVPR